jgi:16S rRNA (guanine527-N7)-methyltransferase
MLCALVAERLQPLRPRYLTYSDNITLKEIRMFSDEQRSQLKQGATVWGLDFTPTTLDRFARYAELLEEANAQFNLTRVRPEDVVTLHFLDSLALASVWRPTAGLHLMDVGAGAGFPGIPLALAFPELNVTLLDSTQKRLKFLDAVIQALGLTQVTTLHGRAEELGRDARWRERYDLVTARAVAKMSTLAEWTLPLVRQGGVAAAYKSREAGVEIEAARPQIGSLGGKIEQIADVVLPGADIARKLVLIRKVRPATGRMRTARTEL